MILAETTTTMNFTIIDVIEIVGLVIAGVWFVSREKAYLLHLINNNQTNIDSNLLEQNNKLQLMDQVCKSSQEINKKDNEIFKLKISQRIKDIEDDLNLLKNI